MSRHRNTPKPPTSRQLCDAEHVNPTIALPGLRVCAHHKAQAVQALTALPDIHRELEEYLVSAGTGNSGTIVSTSIDPGLRLDFAVAKARRVIEQCLIGWVIYAIVPIVVDENGTRTGRSRLNIHPPQGRTPAALAHWIRTHLDWYLAQGNAAAFIDDITHVSRSGRSQRQHDYVRHVDLQQPCPEPDCHGTLMTRLRPADDLLPSEIWCSEAPTDPETGEQTHVWPAGEGWHQLGRKIHRQAIQ